MKLETYYRMMSEATLPCQHCGHGIPIYEIIAMAQMLGTKPRRACPACDQPLSQMEYRDYGVKLKTWEIMSTRGFADTDSRPWWESGKNHPLWAINK